MSCLHLIQQCLLAIQQQPPMLPRYATAKIYEVRDIYFIHTVNITLHSGPVFRLEHATLLWRHNGRDGVSKHQPRDCLLNRSFRRRSEKTSKLRVTGLCAGNSPVTGEFPAQMASNAENVSIWWRHDTGKRQFITIS